MIVKKIMIDDKQIKFGVSARTPRLYKEKFAREVMYDMASFSNDCQKAIKDEGVDDAKQLSSGAMITIVSNHSAMFENLAYIMAKQADPEITEDVEEWLDQFSPFAVVGAFPMLLDMWEMNKKGMSVPKKK